MKPWERLKYLQGNLTEVIKKTVRLESEVGRYRLEKSFYGARVELIRENLSTLRTGEYVVSMLEYRLILRDYYYNRGHYCEAMIELLRVERELEKLREQSAKLEDEMNSLIKEMENNVLVLPSKRSNQQE